MLLLAVFRTNISMLGTMGGERRDVYLHYEKRYFYERVLRGFDRQRRGDIHQRSWRSLYTKYRSQKAGDASLQKG